MPTYNYQCRSCDAAREIVRPISQHTKTIPCECGHDMCQVLMPQSVIPDIEPYLSTVTGERIKGRAHHRAHMREHKLIEIGNERVERKDTPLTPVAPDIKRAMAEVSAR